MLDIPNRQDASALRQAGVFKATLDNLVSGVADDGVLSGFGVSAQGTPDMTVAVAAGRLRILGNFAAYAGGNVTIAAASASFDRIDLIAVDWNGVVSRVAGTAEQYPREPAVPANSILLAQVYVPANATAIDATRIYDRRCVVTDVYDLPDEMLGALVTTGNVGQLAWGLTAATGGTASYQTGTALHPGVLQIITGTGAGNNQRIHLGATATTAILLPANIGRMRAIVQIPTITTIAAKFGFGQDVSDDVAGAFGTAGAFFEFVPATDASWRAVTRQASTSTPTDTTVDVIANNWYDLEIIRRQDATWQFLVNQTLRATQATNAPTTAGTIGFLVEATAAAARSMNIDWFGLNFAPMGARWT